MTPEQKDDISTHIFYIRKDLDEIKESMKVLKSDFVTKIEFEPIKKIVWGLVTAVGLAVVGAIMTLILK